MCGYPCCAGCFSSVEVTEFLIGRGKGSSIIHLMHLEKSMKAGAVPELPDHTIQSRV